MPTEEDETIIIQVDAPDSFIASVVIEQPQEIASIVLDDSSIIASIIVEQPQEVSNIVVDSSEFEVTSIVVDSIGPPGERGAKGDTGNIGLTNNVLVGTYVFLIGVINGTNTIFSTPSSIIIGTPVRVFLNGICLSPNHYIVTQPNNIVLNDAPYAEDIAMVYYYPNSN